MRKTRPDTQTTERATSVAISRIYAMHAMRFSNARYFERRTSRPTGYPTPKFFFFRRNARRHLHIDVLRRAVLNVFFTTESRLYAYQYIFTPGSKLTCFTKSLAPYTANFSLRVRFRVIVYAFSNLVLYRYCQTECATAVLFYRISDTRQRHTTFTSPQWMPVQGNYYCACA